MRRICLLLTDLEIGGTPTVVRELAIRIASRSAAQVTVVALSNEGPLKRPLEDCGIRCVALGACCAADGRIFVRLHQLIRRERFDTVFSFLIHANAAAAIMRLLHPAVRFLQSIQTTQPWPSWHWSLQRLIQVACERVIVPSPSVAAIARRWAGIAPEKITIISNAVELSEFAFDPVLDMTASRDRRRVGFIGRLDPVKCLPDLVEATAVLPPRFRLDIYGDGGDRKRIERAIQLQSLGERVTLHGAISRPQEALANLDVLVLPSMAEGFGLVLIEAMAAGVPVVATNVPGIRDVVVDGQTGLLVPPGAPRELAGAIERIATDQPLRHRLIAAGRQQVMDRFSWENVWEQYRALLRV